MQQQPHHEPTQLPTLIGFNEGIPIERFGRLLQIAMFELLDGWHPDLRGLDGIEQRRWGYLVDWIRLSPKCPKRMQLEWSDELGELLYRLPRTGDRQPFYHAHPPSTPARQDLVAAKWHLSAGLKFSAFRPWIPTLLGGEASLVR